MEINTPKYTAEIFETLSKGQFISSNSTNKFIRTLYSILDDEDNFEYLFDYFNSINFILEKGDQYFYFSRKESKTNLERKLEIAYKWIDILDFLKTYDNAFGPGFKFSPSEISIRLDVDVDLKTKLKGLRRFAPKKSSYIEVIKKIVETLEKNHVVELENDASQTYKVLSSFTYLEELILTINIPEEIADEIPE